MKDKRDKPEVGQRMYSLNIGNMARNRPQKLTQVIVTSVGRKYFSARPEGRGWGEAKFYLDSWVEKPNYTSNQMLYASEQEFEDEKARDRIAVKILETFEDCWATNRTELSLTELQKIESIIFGDPQKGKQ